MITEPEGSPRVFQLNGNYGNKPHEFRAILLVPEFTAIRIVTAAWSYAIRYSARGIDVPDYEKAVELMLKRHPRWQIIGKTCGPVSYYAEYAEEDIADS